MGNIFKELIEVDMNQFFYVKAKNDEYGLKAGKSYLCLGIFTFTPGKIQLMIVGENNDITFTDYIKVTFDKLAGEEQPVAKTADLPSAKPVGAKK